MPGLSFEQLPAAGTMTPESALREQFNASRQQIQNKYALQWKEVNRSARFLGPTKANQMLRQVDMNAKQEMLQFNQKAQTQLAQLQRITAMGQQGLISDADQIKANIVYGRDVAESMFPQEGRSIPQQFGELDVYSHRISQELEHFKLVEKRIPALFGRAGKIGWPILPREKRRQELQIWDPTILVKIKDKDTGKMIDNMGDWRKAKPEEIGIYAAWLKEEKDVARRKRELLGQPGISHRIVQPGTTGGSFSDKIAGSIKPQRQRPTAGPKVIRQRNRRTGQERISYDGGKTWQIVSG